MNQTNNFSFFKKIIFIIALSAISVTNIYAWGSLWTFDRVFATHQLLNEKAYEKLEKHPALLYVDFPILSDIQEHGSVKIGITGKYGLGPDVDGNSFFSQHWYNPNNGQGKAPETIAKLHDYLKKVLWEKEGKNKISKAHSAAYAAHYMQDMTCPMHVTGLNAMKDNNGTIIDFNDQNIAKNISPYAGSYTDYEWKELVKRFKKAYAADKTKTLDFFDPLYFDANYKNPLLLKLDIKSSELGSHFQYEAQVGVKYNLDYKSHDDKWNKLKNQNRPSLPHAYIPDEYDNEMHIDVLAKKAARITHQDMEKGGELWIDIGKSKPAFELPGLSSIINILPPESNRDVIYNSLTVPYKTWWRAIQLTYVTWRSSFSALHIAEFDIRFIKLQNHKNMYQPSIHVRNLEPESMASNVNVSLKISGDIDFNGKVKIPGSIPKYKDANSSKDPDEGISDWINIGKAIMIKDIYNLNGEMEIIITGEYDKHIPDSGEKRAQYDLKDLYVSFEENNINTDKCKKKYSSKIKSIEKEIETIKDFSDGVQGKCAEIKKLLNKQQKQIILEKKTFSEITLQINDLVEKMKNTVKDKEDIEDYDKKIEKLAIEIEKILTDLGELSLKICKKTKTLNNSKIDNSDHKKSSLWIQKNKKELKVYLDQVKERYKEIESYKDKLIRISEKMENIVNIEKKDLDSIVDSIEKMNSISKNINITVAQVESIFADNLTNASIIDSHKATVERSLKSFGKECEKELKDDISKLQIMLDAINLSRCTGGIKTQIKNLKTISVKIKKEATNSAKEAIDITKQLKEYTKNIEMIESLEKDRKKTLLLVNSYLLNAKRFAVNGALCVVLSEEIMDTDTKVLDQIVYRIEGGGFTPHYGRGSYEKVGYRDVLFTLMEPATEAYLKSIIEKVYARYKKDPCETHIPMTPGYKMHPSIWKKGPKVTIIKGPTSGLSSELSINGWKIIRSDGPTFSELKEAAGCKK